MYIHVAFSKFPKIVPYRLSTRVCTALRIDLYVKYDCVKRGIPSENAVEASWRSNTEKSGGFGDPTTTSPLIYIIYIIYV
jgi:hypothetical protein